MCVFILSIFCTYKLLNFLQRKQSSAGPTLLEKNICWRQFRHISPDYQSILEGGCGIVKYRTPSSQVGWYQSFSVILHSPFARVWHWFCQLDWTLYSALSWGSREEEKREEEQEHPPGCSAKPNWFKLRKKWRKRNKKNQTPGCSAVLNSSKLP